MCIFYSVVCLLMDVKSSRDCMVVQFITAYAITAYHHYRGDTTLYDMFVSELRQSGGFLRVFHFHPLKINATRVITDVV